MRKAIVIGATSGMGKELALLLVKAGFMVGITGRRDKELEEVKATDPGKFISSAFDVTDIAVAIISIDELYKKLGGLDLLILSSGTGFLNEKLDFKLESETINLNITGFTAIADWTFNLFAKQNHGHLAVITSVAGLRGSRQSPAYAASKAYQINYLQALVQKAKHLKLPINISDVRPGFVDTAMAKGDGIFWLAPVKKASSQILKAIIEKRNVVYITKRWRLIAIVLKLLPDFVYNKL